MNTNMNPNTAVSFKMVLATCPAAEAEKIGKIIVEKKLAACVNIIDKIKSIYWWKDKLNTDDETLLIFKTTEKKIDNLVSAIKEVHTYEVPEIIVFNIEGGNKDYLKWITESVE